MFSDLFPSALPSVAFIPVAPCELLKLAMIVEETDLEVAAENTPEIPVTSGSVFVSTATVFDFSALIAQASAPSSAVTSDAESASDDDALEI